LSRRTLLEVTAVILFGTAGAADAASPYTLTIVAKTGDTIGGKTLVVVESLVINDSGTIAFRGLFSGGSGIFTPSALLATTGDTIGGKTLTNLEVPAINDSGTVAFFGTFSGGSGIFTPSALLAKTGDTIGGKTLTSFPPSALTGLGSPAINDSGTVAFLGAFSGGSGIFTPSALLAKNGDTIGGKTLSAFGSPAINDRGAVAFLAQFTDFSFGIITAQPFAGTPGHANCHGASVSALSHQFGGMDGAAAALGYTSVRLSRTPFGLFANRPGAYRHAVAEMVGYRKVRRTCLPRLARRAVWNAREFYERKSRRPLDGGYI
jgi:hypothetical protein